MDEKVPRSNYPVWVKLTLLGVPGRAGLWFFVWFSVFVAVACVVYGFWDARFFAGAFFLVSALMYWAAIRWIDQNGTWEKDA